jgi:DNA-binding PadR family transcriptional regulator
MNDKDRIRAEAMLPLKPVEFEVLLVLHGGVLHGYGLAKEIESRSGGRIRLEPANLYRQIHRLVERGLVEDVGRRPAAEVGDERRRYFGLTTVGRQVLEAEAVRLRDAVRAAEARNLLPDAGRTR